MQTLRRHRTPIHPISGGQGGFTLLELLVVIAVLGVLSGVVVFSMGTITDQAEKTACAADERVLRTAAEAYAVTTGSYGDQDALVAAGYLDAPSSSHDIVLEGDDYSIVPTGDCVAGGGEEIAEGAEGADDSADENADGVDEVDGVDGVNEADEIDEPVEQEIVSGRDRGQVGRGPARDRGQVGRGPAWDRGNEVDLSNGNAASCTKGGVDLNSASVKELTAIAHMNPTRAEAAVKLRPFTSVDDLVRVDGIEKKHLGEIYRQGRACV